MKEDFLHYIWRFQYFNRVDLRTTDGEKLDILRPGLHNHYDGPDFSSGKVAVGSLEWHGAIEIHVRASDWYRHRHELDSAYDSVVLHVVWEADRMVFHKDGSPIPTLSLKGKVSPGLWDNYEKLIGNPTSLPCQKSISTVGAMAKVGMLDRTMVRRLERKSVEMAHWLEKNDNDWEQTAYEALGRNFGFKVNASVFQALAEHLPFKVLAKYRGRPFSIEALLFGQSGLLGGEKGCQDDYREALQREYYFLAHKHGLLSKQLSALRWKFMRLRPAGFPTLRIAQFAALLGKVHRLFATLLATERLQDFYELFSAVPSAYWHYHYHFGRSSAQVRKAVLGRGSVENILINTVVPLWACYAQVRGMPGYREKALSLLREIRSEDNRITRTCRALGLPEGSAFHSQATIELYNGFCIGKRCLSCQIGLEVMKRNVVTL